MDVQRSQCGQMDWKQRKKMKESEVMEVAEGTLKATN